MELRHARPRNDPRAQFPGGPTPKRKRIQRQKNSMRNVLSTMYRAIRVAAPGSSDVLKVESLPMLIPKDNEILVHVQAIGINPVETYIRSGKYARGPDGYPFTPGHDCAGIVEAYGKNVTNVQKGDRVYTLRCNSGAYAEYTVADSQYVKPIPTNISYTAAAALPVPYYTAHRALFLKGKIAPGTTVLIHGATGAVGLACCQMARTAGCTVIGTAGSVRGRELLQKYCDHVVMHGNARHNDHSSSSSSFPASSSSLSIVDEILHLTHGKGVSTIVEMLANENLGLDLRMLAMNGQVLIVGNRGDTMINPRELMSREATAMGIMLWHATDDDFSTASNYIHHGLRNGSLVPVVGTVYKGLESAPLAHDEVIEHTQGSYGKIVISLDDDTKEGGNK